MSQQATNGERLLSAKQVGVLYGVDEKTVFRWINMGRIPAPHIRRHKFTRWLYSVIVADISKARNSQLQEATT